MGADYHYSRDGQSFGPVSVEQLRQLAATGQLVATDLVWKEGMAEWVPACRFKGLILAAPSTPARIAIIGTEGSGKTVLTRVLAKRYSHATEKSLFLDPLDNATLKFVERNYQFLASGDWPPSSPVGGLFNLHWRLRDWSNPCSDCELRLADSAGQDLRRVFGDDQEIESLPEHLRGLAEYCRSADIVICLINLKDFVGENDPGRRLDNEAVIKSALGFLIADVSRRRQLYVLFTQADQFEQEREKCGSWENVAKKYLPYVHGAHLLDSRVIVGAVAAVKDTKVVELDGSPRRVPAPGFRSDGLEALMNWVATKVGETVAARVAQCERIDAVQQAQGQQSVRKAEEQRLLEEITRSKVIARFLKSFFWVTLVLLFLTVWFMPTTQIFRVLTGISVWVAMTAGAIGWLGDIIRWQDSFEDALKRLFTLMFVVSLFVIAPLLQIIRDGNGWHGWIAFAVATSASVSVLFILTTIRAIRWF